MEDHTYSQLAGRVSFYNLDEPTRLSSRARATLWLGLFGYLFLIGLLLLRASQPWLELPWVPIGWSIGMLIIYGMLALILYGLAWATYRKGYMYLANASLCSALLFGYTPLAWPYVLNEPAPLLGSAQTSAFLVTSGALVLLAGYAFAAGNLAPSDGTLPIAGRRLVANVAAAVLLAVLIAGFLTLASDLLPQTFSGEGHYGTAQYLIVGGLAFVTLGVTVYTGRQVIRVHSVILMWLMATMVLFLGALIVSLVSDRWTVGWHLTRLITLLGSALLLSVFMVQLGRLGYNNLILARTDPLTGLASRATLINRVVRGLQQGQAVSLIWIDVDGFKRLNNELGHVVGDELLRTLAGRMPLGRHNLVAARTGADEFGIVLTHQGPAEEQQAQTVTLAGEILTRIREPIQLDGSQQRLTASAGVAYWNRTADNGNWTDLARGANLALQEAKNLGGDRVVVYSESLGREAHEEAQLRQEIADAVAARRFDVDFQPIVTAGEHRLAGVEVLVRWLRGRERIEAGSFIPFAERNRQLLGITLVALDRLAEKLDEVLALLPADGFITLNASVQDLADARFVHRLCQQPFTAHADRLIVEVTESLELYESPEATNRLRELSEAGFRMAIDEFGTGYSNLASLTAIRPSLLKLDRSLIVAAGRGDATLARAADSVGHFFSCETVGEGVETLMELQAAEAIPLRYLQGYAIARPLPLDGLRAYRANQSTSPIPLQPDAESR